MYMNYKRKIDQCNLKPILLRWTTSCQIWREKKTFKESEIMSPPKIQLTYCSTTTLAPRYRPVLRKEQNPSLVAIQSDATFRRYAI